MRLNKKKIYAAALIGTMAISVLSIGFASWQTNITAGGNVTAKNSWNVIVTDAAVKTSSVGAVLSATKTSYELARTGVKDDSLIAATISSFDWVEDESLIGTQSNEKMSQYTYYYAVDGSKYDLSDVTGLTKDERNAIAADESTIILSENLNMYYRYMDNSSLGTPGTSDYANASAALVVDGLLRDADALIKTKYPENYKNYVVVYLSASLMSSNHTIGAFDEKEVTGQLADGDATAIIKNDGTAVTYADVSFGIPGAWAEYTLTVANNGTVDANLADVVIGLETDNEEQLVLRKPDLNGEVLKAGERCTITFVVQVPESVTRDLNVAGTLLVTLPYSQSAVEAAPEVSHSHN